MIDFHLSQTKNTLLAIDPGLNKTGYAVLKHNGESLRVLECGVIRSERGAGVSTRVHEIARSVREIITEYSPHDLIIEQAFTLPKNPKSSILMSHVRGAILFLAEDASMRVYHYEATKIKKALTGNGHADKSEVCRAVERECNLDFSSAPHDVADAVAIGLCHYFSPKIQLAEFN